MLKDKSDECERKVSKHLKGTPISYIQDVGKGREYSWEFFIKPTTLSELSKRLYPNLFEKVKKRQKKESWDYYWIREHLNQWGKLGYFDKEKVYEKRRGKSNSIRKHPISTSIFNLNPLFDYAKSRGKKFEFTHPQKIILEVLFISEEIREDIYKNYKDTDDFITALLKFYISYFIKRKIGVSSYKSKSIIKQVKKENKKIGTTYDILNELYRWGVPYPSDYQKEEKCLKEEGDNYKIIPIDMTGIKVTNLTKMSITEEIRAQLKDNLVTVSYYYYLYEKFHEEMKEIMADLDFKILNLLLNQNFSLKNK